MLKRILILTAVLLLSTNIWANMVLPKLSVQSKVVMFTCEPGSELYAGFGHSAIWVNDPNQGVDRLYNFGTFDFNTPNFYWLFIRGKLDYMLTVTTARRFIDEYNYRKIGVTGQTLSLTENEKQRLFELLETNLLPENRLYKYDFFYDNCATRIRDVVVKAADGKVDFNTPDQNVTFREMLFPYIAHTPWTKFGINLILGLSSDKKAPPFDYMYLPEHMQLQFNNATIDRDGNIGKLVVSEQKYLDSGLVFAYNILNDPALLFGLLFLLIGAVTLIELRRKIYFRWLDAIFNTTAVIAGLFLLFMWLGTDHSATNYNLNILWLLPAQAFFTISLFSKHKTTKFKLVNTSFIIICATIFAMFFWPQKTELSFFIIAFIYAMRYLFFKRIYVESEQ